MGEYRKLSEELFKQSYELRKIAWIYEKKATLDEIHERIKNIRMEIRGRFQYKIVVEEHHYDVLEREYTLYYYIVDDFNITEREIKHNIKEALKDEMINNRETTYCGQDYIEIVKVNHLNELSKLEDKMIREDSLEGIWIKE